MKKTIIYNGKELELEVTEIESGKYDYNLSLPKCSDYKALINMPGFDYRDFEKVLATEKIQISTTCYPADALTKKDIGKMSDAELVKRVNEMALLPKKPIYMYANGYGFAWQFFTDLMEYKGFTNVSESRQNPQYEIPASVSEPEIIQIDKLDGTKNVVECRYRISEEAEANLNKITNGLNKVEKGRVAAEILNRSFKYWATEKENGNLKIKALRKSSKEEYVDV